MSQVVSDTVRRVGEYYDFIAFLNEPVDPLQAAMFVELEFGLVIPDDEITEANLAHPAAAARLVERLTAIRVRSA